MCTFAQAVPVKPLNNAQIDGPFFVYARVFYVSY